MRRAEEEEEEEEGVAHPQKGSSRRCKPKGGGKAKRSPFLPRWPWFKSCHGLMVSLQAPLTCFFFFLFSFPRIEPTSFAFIRFVQMWGRGREEEEEEKVEERKKGERTLI